LLSLSNVVYRSPAVREVELWRVGKDSRELRCLAVYMPTGIDLGRSACSSFSPWCSSRLMDA
jgi:hypothetical protein